MKQYILSGLLAAPLFVACSSSPKLDTVPRVDLPRFMGDWYVIASIPTFIEKDIYNAVESYRLDDDGTIATTFTFRKGGFDGKEKTYRPRGFVVNTETNAHWDMQFVWPFKSEFLIIHLDGEYRHTVIGRSKLDYLWIMSRKPVMPAPVYDAIIEKVKAVGYDTSRIRKVPQKWD
ncbi:MAG: lipocalin family protein [Spirochaetes bacterium]|nr:lipocalin family protein [Spirochaetota bacterium]